jgi:hypothetical protein
VVGIGVGREVGNSDGFHVWLVGAAVAVGDNEGSNEGG